MGREMRPAFKSGCLLPLLFFCFGCSRIQTKDSSPDMSNKAPGTIHTELPANSNASFLPLIGRIWRVSDAPYGPASGSIFIFLPNGTLLETSCVETYRIATWSVDKTQPDTLRVVEDQQLAFTGTLGEAAANTLHLHKKLPRSGELQDITLAALDSEFVCPDLRK
jgi:hypothetical protein